MSLFSKTASSAKMPSMSIPDIGGGANALAAVNSVSSEMISGLQDSAIFGNMSSMLSEQGGKLSQALTDTIGSITKTDLFDKLSANLKTPTIDPFKDMLSNTDILPPTIYITNPITGGLDPIQELSKLSTSKDMLSKMDPKKLKTLAERLGKSVPVSDGELANMKDGLNKVASQVLNNTSLSNDIPKTVEYTKDMASDVFGKSLGSFDGFDLSDVTTIGKSNFSFGSVINDIKDFAKSDIGRDLLKISGMASSMAASFIPGYSKIGTQVGNVISKIPGIPKNIGYQDGYNYAKQLNTNYGFACASGYTDYTNLDNKQNGFNALLRWGLDNNMTSMLDCVISSASPWLNNDTKKAINRYIPSLAKSSSPNLLTRAISLAGGKQLGGNGRSILRNTLSSGKVNAGHIQSIISIGAALGTSVADAFKTTASPPNDIVWDEPPSGHANVYDGNFIRSVPSHITNSLTGSNIGNKISGTSYRKYVNNANNENTRSDLASLHRSLRNVDMMNAKNNYSVQLGIADL